MKISPDTIVRNSIITVDGDVLTSTHVHDCDMGVIRSAGAGNEVGCDGGLEYLRRIGDPRHYIENSLSYGDGHKICREIKLWGTRGKDGNGPLTKVSVSEMETSHMLQILNEYDSLQPVIKQIMLDEIKMRKSLTRG